MKQPSLREQTFHGIDREACLGPGHSRPEPGKRTRMYRVALKPCDSGRMVVQLPAESKTKARVYVQNRWPRCFVTSIELVKQ
jgi:hypothetical protein